MTPATSRDVILFVNAIRPATFEALDSFRQKTGRTFTPVVIVDEKIQASITERNGQTQLADTHITIHADFDSAAAVRQALKPYHGRIFAVTSQYENSILELKKLIPYLPDLLMPTESSLDWSTEKKLMRELSKAHDESLIPKYLEVLDASDATIEHIEQTIPYPVIVKPSGLEGSLLVSLAKDRQELQATIKHTFGEIQKGYDTWIKRQRPLVLVEEFMVGDMYSIDTYVGADGTCRHTPPVKVVTGRQVGFDDFFGYMQMAPSGLSDSEIAAASAVAQKACHALGLRSVTAHIELMKTAAGWKIIELGPRIGGYRHEIYSHTYGINHIMNDIRNRAGEIPDIPTAVLSPTAAFNIYAPEEGVLASVAGIEAVRGLSSFVSLKQNIPVNSVVRFAKNNGDRVFQIILSNPIPDQLYADIRFLEQSLRLGVIPAPL